MPAPAMRHPGVWVFQTAYLPDTGLPCSVIPEPAADSV